MELLSGQAWPPGILLGLAQYSRSSKLTDEEAEEQILALNECNDLEQAHVDADHILCKLLEDLGYPKTVVAFRNLDKWYA